MKTFLSICFFVTFVGLILIGCSDKSISPVETSGNPVVLPKETGPGAWIFKYEYNLAFWFPDEEAGLVLTLGIDSDPWTFCSDFNGESFSYKDIFLPNSDPDLRRMFEAMKGKGITAKIWQVEPWPTDYSLCTFFGLTPFEPMAVGTANITTKNNDVLAWDQDNNNSNALGFKVNGTIVGQDGKVYKLSFIYNYIWDGDDGSRFNEVYKFQLTPTGK